MQDFAGTQQDYGGRDATTSAGPAERTRPVPAAGQPQPRVGLQVTAIFLWGSWPPVFSRALLRLLEMGSPLRSTQGTTYHHG